MTPEPPRYDEPGVGWTALLWAPLFALAGLLAELATGGPVHWLAWILVAAGLVAITVPWVYARRRYLSLEVTSDGYRQGKETLEAARIAEVLEDEAPVGSRVLGGGWTIPKKFGEVGLKLEDGVFVRAWAKDPDALREALGDLVRARTTES
ncbi:hypothetical protein [Amycolatopsis keratiniphila]|uniref:DUF3093 domain-containing protein n=1 Tax=Amycolatopsis keratiniphila subsp. keratiniphila TaxID=227715 RepID=A0A1W2LQG7_9PSEU|nr:hypothetical protein [Amycolatopsis keratiniphila]OLZ56206.1 hypothetical protein BS330_19030 [Amycolatopsis keratiniphila subsp. nogabecina]ONF66239.1 hypothetical protein AVR91_0225290 [Amycolatopsis keratiniphila subsp. keratiniphila]SDU52498.1 hypothetical protein SAMN04489733_5470 [Amycolatopsis keratiniphila]